VNQRFEFIVQRDFAKLLRLETFYHIALDLNQCNASSDIAHDVLFAAAFDLMKAYSRH
jgi:hypothetical protein